MGAYRLKLSGGLLRGGDRANLCLASGPRLEGWASYAATLSHF